MKIVHDDYKNLISLENLFRAWRKFKIGKNKKFDVMEFERHLEDNLFALYQELLEKRYIHLRYEYFKVKDPKKRDIHKANVKDRIIHQALYVYLQDIYEPFFIEDSYSSRINKGTHKAIKRLRRFAEEIAKRNNGYCFALKFDIKKFFENIDHKILLKLLNDRVKDKNILNLLRLVIESFNGSAGKGIPLGNITSQIFANIYLHELDIFIKSRLKLQYYLRYNDDFIILSSNKMALFKYVNKIREFVGRGLLLEIPDNKIIFRKLNWGIDFCGYVILQDSVLLRQKTKKRMMERVRELSERHDGGKSSLEDLNKTVNSYFGLLKHCNSYNLKEKIKNKYIYGKII